MIKLMLSFMMILSTFVMMFTHHPLSMGLLILMQTLLTCLLSGMMIQSYWFSYILFLTFLGGLLVLFIYVSSIASNELFTMKPMKKFIILNFSIILMMMMYILYYKLFWMNFSFNYEMNNFYNKFIFFNNENKFNLSKLYNNQTFILMIMMMIYLFITLIATVKITNIFYGPLRSL